MEFEEASGPLRGIRVIDASTFIAGPMATLCLAEMGASVIKVEPPEGDPGRRAGRRVNGESTLFANVNRCKRSIALDLKKRADADLMMQLIGQADVFVENWRPGVAERLGLTDTRLNAVNPDLIHVSITAFGRSGPRKLAPGFDGNLQALSGIAWHNAHDGRPERVRFYLVDKATATFVAQSVLAALLRREREHSGGARIDVNMLDSAAYFNFPDVFEGRTALADNDGGGDPFPAWSHSVTRTSDGFIIVSPGTSEHLRRACEAVGHPEWLPDFKQLKSFSAIMPLLNARLESRFERTTTAEAVALLQDHDVPVCAVADLDAHLKDPQVVHNATYAVTEHAVMGKVRHPRYPARFFDAGGSTPSAHRATIYPNLNEHGDTIRGSIDADSILDEKLVWQDFGSI